MSTNGGNGLSGFSFAELFALEADEQTTVLTQGLLALERNPGDPQTLESLMRAAHSLKGAARIVSREPAVRLTHVFVGAQAGEQSLPPQRIDLFLLAVDLLRRMAGVTEAEIESWDAAHESELEAFLEALVKPAEELPENFLADETVETPDEPEHEPEPAPILPPPPEPVAPTAVAAVTEAPPV
jgi:two-component system sensor histidine kinase and response regulator WspE